jgi:uncharacterized membrane protein
MDLRLVFFVVAMIYLVFRGSSLAKRSVECYCGRTRSLLATAIAGPGFASVLLLLCATGPFMLRDHSYLWYIAVLLVARLLAQCIARIVTRLDARADATRSTALDVSANRSARWMPWIHVVVVATLAWTYREAILGHGNTNTMPRIVWPGHEVEIEIGTVEALDGHYDLYATEVTAFGTARHDVTGAINAWEPSDIRGVYDGWVESPVWSRRSTVVRLPITVPSMLQGPATLTMHYDAIVRVPRFAESPAKEDDRVNLEGDVSFRLHAGRELWTDYLLRVAGHAVTLSVFMALALFTIEEMRSRR